MRHVQNIPRRVVLHDPVWITFKDDTHLAARIWRPEDAETDKLPAILEHLCRIAAATPRRYATN
jgi:hypothetical protein